MNVNAGIRRHSRDETNIVDIDFDLMSYVLGENDSPPSPPPRKSKRKYNVRRTLETSDV